MVQYNFKTDMLNVAHQTQKQQRTDNLIEGNVSGYYNNPAACLVIVRHAVSLGCIFIAMEVTGRNWQVGC